MSNEHAQSDEWFRELVSWLVYVRYGSLLLALFLLTELAFKSGGWAFGILSLVFFPITLLVGPLLAGIVAGSWYPALFAYGIPLLLIVLLFGSAKLLSDPSGTIAHAPTPWPPGENLSQETPATS